MALPLYAPWSANALLAATPSLVGGTVEAALPLANLTIGDPATPCRLSTTSGLFLYDFGTPVHVTDMYALHHNIRPGVAVSVRAYATLPTALGDAPALTVPVTVGAANAYGYRPNLRADVNAVDAALTAQYWGWAVTGANAVALILGELFATLSRTSLPRWLQLGDTDDPRIVNVTNRSYGGTDFSAAKEPPVRILSGTLVSSVSDAEAITDWWLGSGGSRQPSIIVKNNGADVLMGKFQGESFGRGATDAGVRTFPVNFRELSRGLVWP